jgi:quercetin dioxygenase-like cupin family protein
MPEAFAYFADVSLQLQIPATGMLSRPLHDDEHVKVIVFALAPGHEFASHLAAMATSLYFVTGAASVTLGDEVREANAGTFVHMQPKLPHAIVARTAVVMLLQIYKQNR